MHFPDVFIEDIWCTFRLMQSLLPHPYSSKKLFEFVQISWPTLAEVVWARAHPCRTMAMPLNGCVKENTVINVQQILYYHAAVN